MQPDAKALLHDAIRALELTAQFLSGETRADFEASDLLRSAVERQFTVAGEALAVLRRTDPNTAARIAELPAVVGLRNVLVHGYAIVNRDVLWRTAKHDVAPMLAALRAALEAEE